MAWAEYMNHEERVKYEVVNMVKILEHDGMPRTQSIQKIINDHKDLPGFSRRTIYRELPEDMKRDYTKEDKKLSVTKNVSRDTFETNEKGGNEEDQNLIADMDVMYDANFVNSLIAENEQLKIENFRIKKDYQELETKYKKLLNKTKSD